MQLCSIKCKFKMAHSTWILVGATFSRPPPPLCHPQNKTINMSTVIMYLTHVCNYNYSTLYLREDFGNRCFREDSLGETLLHTCICISSNQCVNIYEKIKVCSPSHCEQHGNRIGQHPMREIMFMF